MLNIHPSEVSALQERIDRLEQRNQRLAEIISDLRDSEATLRRRVHILHRELVGAVKCR